MTSNRWTEIDGEGIAWGAGAFAASLVVGVIFEWFRATVGLENVTIVYLLIVIIAAAFGGRAAGLVAAVSAALSYNFFHTTPYHTLRIDSFAQIATVLLLFGAGIVAALAGRSRRRAALDAAQQAEVGHLLNTILRAVAAGANVDQLAASGLGRLLDARRVIVRRTGPAEDVVSVDLVDPAARADTVLEGHELPRLDAEGRLPPGFFRVRDGRLPHRPAGVVAALVGVGQPVGELVVVTGADRPISAAGRLTVATVAHALAAAPPHAPAPEAQRPLTR
jgi:hypothetical protein